MAGKTSVVLSYGLQRSLDDNKALSRSRILRPLGPTGSDCCHSQILPVSVTWFLKPFLYPSSVVWSQFVWKHEAPEERGYHTLNWQLQCVSWGWVAQSLPDRGKKTHVFLFISSPPLSGYQTVIESQRYAFLCHFCPRRRRVDFPGSRH